jgi:hypothetical protein
VTVARPIALRVNHPTPCRASTGSGESESVLFYIVLVNVLNLSPGQKNDIRTACVEVMSSILGAYNDPFALQILDINICGSCHIVFTRLQFLLSIMVVIVMEK